jgi:hypothetical protein
MGSCLEAPVTAVAGKSGDSNVKSFRTASAKNYLAVLIIYPQCKLHYLLEVDTWRIRETK